MLKEIKLWNLVLENEFNKYIDECSINLKDLKLNILPQLEEAIININKCFSLEGKIFFFGSGGSSSDS